MSDNIFIKIDKLFILRDRLSHNKEAVKEINKIIMEIEVSPDIKQSKSTTVTHHKDGIFSSVSSVDYKE